MKVGKIMALKKNSRKTRAASPSGKDSFHLLVEKGSGQQKDDYFKNVLDNMSEGIQIIGNDWHYLYVNDVAARQGKKDKSDFPGQRMMDIYPHIENTEMFKVLTDCMQSRTSTTMLNEFIYPDG